MFVAFFPMAPLALLVAVVRGSAPLAARRGSHRAASGALLDPRRGRADHCRREITTSDFDTLRPRHDVLVLGDVRVRKVGEPDTPRGHHQTVPDVDHFHDHVGVGGAGAVRGGLWKNLDELPRNVERTPRAHEEKQLLLRLPLGGAGHPRVGGLFGFDQHGGEAAEAVDRHGGVPLLALGRQRHRHPDCVGQCGQNVRREARPDELHRRHRVHGLLPMRRHRM
jgi:hypothetical protein